MERFLPSSGLLDRLGIGLSGLCLVHCLASTIVLVLLSSGGVLVSPHLHEIGLALAIPLGAVALGLGMVRHGYVVPSLVGAAGLGIMGLALGLPHGGGEVLLTLTGVGVLALGHQLNRRASA